MCDPRMSPRRVSYAPCMLLLLLVAVSGCQKPADAPQVQAHKPTIALPDAETDIAGAPPDIDTLPEPDPLAPLEERAPGSLSCTTTGAYGEDLRLPVTATYDPNSSFVRFSLDAAGESPRSFSLVLNGWSGLPATGEYIRQFRRAELAEGTEESQAFFVLELQGLRWVAESLDLTLRLQESDVSGEFSALLVNPDGATLQVSNGLFIAPLRRLAELPADSSGSAAGS